MEFLEKDLEQIIFDNLQTIDGCELLAERFLEIAYLPFVKRQFRIGNYGIADIITAGKITEMYQKRNDPNFYVRSNLEINIYELKKHEINIDTLIQSMRYYKGIRRYLQIRDFSNYEVNIILIGSKICINDWVYLTKPFTHLFVYTYDYDINGIIFKPQDLRNYKLIKEGF